MLLAIPVLLAGSVVSAENINPWNDGSKYAWGENVGWLNAQPLGPGGPGIEVTDSRLTGWAWSENAGWVSLSCTNRSSCGAVDYGVTNDGCGNLAGYAWSENAGWINFAPTDAGVRIDPATGIFSGRAWSENAGWITFSSTGPNPYRVQTSWRGVAPGKTTGLIAVNKTQLTWNALAGATSYDVVRGDLRLLHLNGGNFTPTVQKCIANNILGTSAWDPEKPRDPTPPPPPPYEPEIFQGFWYLVRGNNCGGAGYGTYDDDAAKLIPGRDAEINASYNSCP